jgi:hypothetical protein
VATPTSRAELVVSYLPPATTFIYGRRSSGSLIDGRSVCKKEQGSRPRRSMCVLAPRVAFESKTTFPPALLTWAAEAPNDRARAVPSPEERLLVANRSRPGRSPSRPAAGPAPLARRRRLLRTRPRNRANVVRGGDQAGSASPSVIAPRRSRPRRQSSHAASARASGLADRRSPDCDTGHSSRSRRPTLVARGWSDPRCRRRM